MNLMRTRVSWRYWLLIFSLIYTCEAENRYDLHEGSQDDVLKPVNQCPRACAIPKMKGNSIEVACLTDYDENDDPEIANIIEVLKNLDVLKYFNIDECDVMSGCQEIVIDFTDLTDTIRAYTSNSRDCCKNFEQCRYDFAPLDLKFCSKCNFNGIPTIPGKICEDYSSKSEALAKYCPPAKPAPPRPPGTTSKPETTTFANVTTEEPAVEEKSYLWIYILAGIAALLIALALVAFFLWRRDDAQPSPTTRMSRARAGSMIPSSQARPISTAPTFQSSRVSTRPSTRSSQTSMPSASSAAIKTQRSAAYTTSRSPSKRVSRSSYPSTNMSTSRRSSKSGSGSRSRSRH